MCSLPFPDAKESETSNSFEISFDNKECNCDFNSASGWVESISINLHFSVFGKFGEDLFFTRIIFSTSGMRFIRAVTCPQFSLSSPRNATSSIFCLDAKSL